MKIHIDDIPAEGLELHRGGDDPQWQEVRATLQDPDVAFVLSCDLRLERTEAVVSVAGRLHGQVSLPCARCLATVIVPVEEEISFHLRPPLDGQELGGEELELDSEALEYAFYEGATLDSDRLIEEQVVLAVPPRVLCRPDCKGICQGCGAELNTEPCRCTAAPVDPRFAGLLKLKVPSKSS